MDLNEYTMTWLVRQRLRELEAEAQRQRLVASARRTSHRRLRLVLGVVLVRLGSRLTVIPHFFLRRRPRTGKLGSRRESSSSVPHRSAD